MTGSETEFADTAEGPGPRFEPRFKHKKMCSLAAPRFLNHGMAKATA